MATSISGNVRLTYGTHTHNETFSTTATTLTQDNASHNYSAGGGRASTTGTALDQLAGTSQSGAEGLLLIKNTNTVGHLLVALDGDNNYDIKIPADTANLISVGTEGVVFIKSAVSNLSRGVTSFTTAGVITFDSAVTTAGTYLMFATANGGGSTGAIHTSAGPHFIMKTTSDATTTGTVYELDGTTAKDLTGLYAGDTVVTLNAAVDYRYTLTEA